MESLGANAIIILYAGALLAVTAQFRWFPIRGGVFCHRVHDYCREMWRYRCLYIWAVMGKTEDGSGIESGKTWMGFVGAIVGSTVGGSLWLMFGGRLFDAEPRANSYFWSQRTRPQSA